MKLKSIVFLFIIISMFSCKKYKDNPPIVFGSEEKRIRGLHDVDLFTVDGADSTSALKQQPCFAGLIFDPTKEHQVVRIENTNFHRNGVWKFIDSKKQLYIRILNYINMGNGGIGGSGTIMGPYGAPEVTWTITRLTKKEIWLKTDYNGKKYFLKLR